MPRRLSRSCATGRIDPAFLKRCGSHRNPQRIDQQWDTACSTWVPSTTATSARRAPGVPLLTVTKGQPRSFLSSVAAYPQMTILLVRIMIAARSSKLAILVIPVGTVGVGPEQSRCPGMLTQWQPSGGDHEQCVAGPIG